jgi:serine/threonine protein kinase
MLMARNVHSLGDNIGRYRLIGEIARGGMGIVYIAAAHGPAGFSKLVALKELRPDLVDDGEFLTMFLEEARMAARLSHPNIVQTNDVSEHEERHFIAMEYLEGRALYHVLKRFARRGGFPQRMALTVLRDALSALDYAHELTGFDGKPLGFVHRDISPHNIFLTFEGHTKVIDFGIAKARDSSLETKTGVLKGRANYMAPEQLMRRTDRRSDIFSIGAILFEILSGRRLWQGMGDVEILAALTRGAIPSLQAVRGGPGARSDAPPLLVEICERALQPRPEDRFATAAQMRDALDQFLWSSGGAPQAREMSELLMQEFESERQHTRALIEAALQRLHEGSGGELQTLATTEAHEESRMAALSRKLPAPPPGDAMTGSGRRVRSEASMMARLPGNTSARLNAGDARPPAGDAGGEELFGGPPPSSVSRVSSPSRRMPPVTAENLLVAQPPFEPIRDGGVKRRTGLIAAALGVVFVGTTLGVALHRAPPAEPTVATPIGAPPPAARASELPTPTPPAPATGAPSTGAETIVFSVSVTPSTAQVYIDGHAMPSNPFLGRFAKSPGTHRVRAVAPGYVPKERLVTFDDNVMIDLSLPLNRPTAPPHHEAPPARRESSPAARAPVSAPEAAPVIAAPLPPPKASAPVDVAPRGEWEPPRKRKIDTTNPYGDEK